MQTSNGMSNRSAPEGLLLSTDWDKRSLRTTLGRFATGVTIVTTRGKDGSRIGLTVNSFSALSLDPPLVLWSLGKSQGSLEAFRTCSQFAINVLSESQIALSQRFSSPVADRFAGVDFACSDDGIPLIGGCAAYFLCNSYQHMELGDHLLFVGQVERLGMTRDRALLFHDGAYAIPASHPEWQPKPPSVS
ncbi:flavin reductase family protein [Achromobacter aegrifaciens]